MNDRPPARQEAPAATGKPARNDDGREFWEVWSEEVGRTPNAASENKNEPAPAPPSDALPSVLDARPAIPDVPVTAQLPSGQVRLYVNLGRKDGVTAELVAELLSSTGAVVPATDVELMNTHCYVNVAAEVADALCSGMNGRAHNGRAVVCERARPPKRRY